ncbi:hypothetical protein ATK74_2849 [Propionicimonas paludicola]|uniref:Uncharacterized protein n=1 Tax=Propionicimonas paludicola TaxID=185243 RepID=A0A2A9CW75_9ACTN|nr:hypothetical protein [Propionicimonas paludicola]PFG18265.1 hypothetical protein ATK74_2849 [Propionicimonas paludicola]
MRRIFRTVVSIALTGLLTLGFLAPTSAEAASKKVSAGSVKISGTAKVGETLTAATASWKPAGVVLKYQWYRSGKKIGGATKATYTLGSSDLNKQITVKVTGSLSKYKAASKTSGKTKKVGLGTISYVGIDLTGAVAVGGTVRVVGAWKPADTKVKYQWYSDDVPMKGATSRTYAIRSADETHRLGVVIHVSRKGYKTRDLYWKFNYDVGSRGSQDGLLEVGTDIKPGTYVAPGGSLCEWDREDRGFSVLGAGPNSDGQVIVTINPGDRYFYNRGCGTWRTFEPSAMKQMTYFIDGQFSVGPEIKPGTYETNWWNGECYWQTNSGFDGSRDDFIADGRATYPHDPIRVVLDSSVTGFESRDCGGWYRVED